MKSLIVARSFCLEDVRKKDLSLLSFSPSVPQGMQSWSFVSVGHLFRSMDLHDRSIDRSGGRPALPTTPIAYALVTLSTHANSSTGCACFLSRFFNRLKRERSLDLVWIFRDRCTPSAPSNTITHFPSVSPHVPTEVNKSL
mmetsp:Transcript_30426/g.59767  ORF Transcript_30426/g.59767 Transcript_30426/m.59767 type:complete len:141 (+) Transcript_30426:1109-1531(+)